MQESDPLTDCVFSLATMIMCLAQVHMMLSTHQVEHTMVGFDVRCREIMAWCEQQMRELIEFGSAFDGMKGDDDDPEGS